MRLVTQASVRRSLQPGDRVDDHLIIRSVLGKGGTAVVYEALHTRLNALVALKVVEVDAAYAADAAARLEREALVCAAIDDPHVPKIFDVGALNDGTPYIVMEKVSGPTLEHMLGQGRLRPRVAVSIVRDLLSALSAVHRVGVVHRDVKPANLIVQTADDGAYRVRLMDFGVSKAMSHHRVDPAITHQGALVGTPHYMAPEQISDEGVDGRTDVYAAGVLLYELLTGRLPFDGGSTAEVMTAVLRHSFAPVSALNPEVSLTLSTAVARAMAERPEDRYASAREMRDALDQALGTMDAKVAAARKPHAFSTSRRTALWAFASITLAFVLALGSRHASHAAAEKQGTEAVPHVRTVTANVPAERKDAAPSAQPLGVSDTKPETTAVRKVSPSPRKPASATSNKGARSSAVARQETSAEEIPISSGRLVSEYVRELDELTRAVSDVAADLEQGPLPPNPYR